MGKATADRTQIYRFRETVWGVTPPSPALIETRMTGEDLADNITFEDSKEIRADRQLIDTTAVDGSPSGGINIELSYTEYQDLLEALLMSTWSADLGIVGAAGDISTVAAASDNVTSTTAGKFSNVVLGQKIKLGGFTDPLNNGVYSVTGITSDQSITVFPQPNSAETPAGAAATISGSFIRNGVQEYSYGLVKQYNDATVMTRQVFSGMRVTSASLSASTGAIVTGNFKFMGKSAEFTEGTFAGETIVAASTDEVMNSVTNLTTILQDGALIGTPGSVLTLSVDIDNKHREQKGLTVLGNTGVAAGQLVVGITSTMYFESKAQADKFRNGTVFSFTVGFVANDGKELHLTFPRCKFKTFTAPASGLNTDIVANTTFTALRDPVTNAMIQLDRFA